MTKWRLIPGYSKYKVSNSGSVKRIGGKILKPYIDRRDGYRWVGLSINGVQTNHRVCRLVLLAFVGPRPKGLECRHLNDIPSDDRLTNLCWGTHSENARDRVKNGKHYQPEVTGESNGRAKINENIVRWIRQEARHRPKASIARELGMGASTIGDIVSGKRWKHVT